ncbi:MAG: lipocalin family protein [Acidobacteriota bacterium]
MQPVRYHPCWAVLIVAFFALFGDLLGASAEEQTGPAAGAETERRVDLTRYAGVWYEVARLPNRFQRKCFRDTTAEYTLRPNGELTVVNRCYTQEGKLKEAKGRAKVVDRTTNRRLKVSFVRLLGISLFWGDYWILALDPDYRWALVGSPDRKYGWVLSRKPVSSEEQWRRFEAILLQHGFDPGRFERTPHTGAR